jgi:tRNA threonylcarbamoyladenosine biosynthesis protein TsaE
MTSPSFTLVATYPIPQADDPESQANAVAPARHVVHIDLYRMASEEEVDLLGLEEYFTNDRIVLVEWPERARDLLPAACIEVDIVATGATRRRISISRRDEAAP